MLQAVFLIPADHRPNLSVLFPEQNGLIRSCLDGCMGNAYGDHPLMPSAVLLTNGDFAAFGGNFLSHAARQLAGKLALEKGKTWLIPAQMGWREHIAYWQPRSIISSTRYALKTAEVFNITELTELIHAIPEEVKLQHIDNHLYQRIIAEEWCRDWCSQFRDADDYAKRGAGVAAMVNGELVAGASSYVIYHDGIEIQTDTRADMRRRGLAAACCAELIIDCVGKGIHPSWDAANTASLQLAQKLGYSLIKPYGVWEVSF